MAATAVLFSACTQDGTPPATDSASGSSTAAGGDVVPNLYLDRSLEFLVGGVPLKREGYFERLQYCRDAGVPTAALSEAEAALIDTGRRQYWRTADAVAIREERWEEGQAEMCRFELRQVGQHAYYDASGSVFLDLATGEITTGPVSARHLDRRPVDPGAASAAADWIGPAIREVAGHTCEQWESPNGATVCTWAGGHDWGYVPTITSVYDTSIKDVEALVLEAAPAPGKVGIHVSTDTFIVGGPVDTVSMRPAGLNAGGEAL